MLTKKKCDQAQYDPDGPHQQIHYDGSLPAFGLRIYPTGRKSFVVRYRTQSGRLRHHTIAAYGVATLDEARKRARKVLLQVSDGQDPQAERKQKRTSLTLKEFCKRYIDEYAKEKKRSWKEDKRRIDNRIVPAIGNRKLQEVSRSDVERLHVKIGSEGSHAEANRVLALVSKIYTMAVKWENLPEGFINPSKGIDKYPETSRKRYVEREKEMPRLLKEINKEPNPHIRGVLLLLLLTGCRRSELLRAKWEHIDWNQRILHLPETKSGKAQITPLSAPALALLKMIPRDQDNPYIFPSAVKPGEHMADIKRSWKEIRTRAKLPDITLHDLRRTVGSWLVLDGASQALVGAVLRHGSLDSTETYTVIPDTAAATALEGHGQSLQDIKGFKELLEKVESDD